MKVIQGTIPGVLLIEPVPVADERGFFARTLSRELRTRYRLPESADHQALAWNPRRGTLRGLHWQDPPNLEHKLVQCLRGAIWDVVVDLRLASPTFLGWEAFRLDGRGLSLLSIPPGLAHGYLTLEEESLVEYAISVPYVASAARGLRWNDPRLAIDWPEAPRLISTRDQELPMLTGEFVGFDLGHRG